MSSPLCSGIPIPTPTPGYSENGHKPDVTGEAWSCLILKNPVSDAACEEGNGHFPWGERGDTSVTKRYERTTHDSCPSPFTTVQKAELADPSLFSYIKLFKGYLRKMAVSRTWGAGC